MRGPSQLREEVRVEEPGAREPEIIPPGAGRIYVGDDPDAEYVREKLEMDEGKKDLESMEQLCLLKTRPDDVKHTYFLREEAFETQYRPEREMLHSEDLKNNPHGLSDLVAAHLPPSEAVLPPKHQPLEPKPPETTVTNDDIFDNDSDDGSSGGFFAILQQLPATEITASGSIVRLQPMELPEHWSDRLPKSILQEVIAKKDKYAVAKYACISGPSRVIRASVTITWDGGRTQSWSMDDVGCPDLKQAEEYISTIALHVLTFPTLEGFALGGTYVANTQTFFRRLPPAFRNLWDELEAKRKESDDTTNRAAWEKLRAIARVKLESQPKVLSLDVATGFTLHVLQPTGKPLKVAGGGKDETTSRNIFSQKLSEEQLKAGFEARRASPAYQQMLVRVCYSCCFHGS